MIAYLSLFVALVSFWICSYKFLVSKGFRSEIVFSTLSMTHWAFATIYFSCLSFFSLDLDVKEGNFGRSMTEFQFYFHILTCSYYGFDIIAKQLKKQLDSWLLIHHGLTLFFIAVAVLYQQAGSENIYILRYATACNVPMNLKYILRLKNRQNSPQYHVANIAYVSIYSVMFFYCLPACLIAFYECETNALTKSLLVLLCIQAQYTTIATLSKSLFKSVHCLGVQTIEATCKVIEKIKVAAKFQ